MPAPPQWSPTRGTATLNGLSTVNVPAPDITAASLIFTGIKDPAGTLGAILITSKTPGVGFSVTSVLLNTSVMSWMILEP